ncbi:MAG: cobalamin-binding protein [Dehalococcoidales bacterium]|nr:cobalamin-binding protein [Dehalococcoidales bacterium]
MKIGRLLFVIIMLSLAAMAGCQTSAPQGDIIDDLGRNVQIKDVPQRIISLSPSNTEIVYALGLEDRLIGVTTYCNYPPEVKDKPQVSQFSNVDIEKVVALEPDLILADSLHEADVIPALEKLGITVLAINPATMEEIFGDIGMIGRAAGQTESAESLLASLQDRTKAVTDRTAGPESGEKYRTFFVTWHDPIWTAGSGTLINDLITRAGGTNIAADLKGHSQIDLETVIQRNPQVILILSSMGTQDNSFNYIKTEPRFQATDALKNNRVYLVDADIISRTTPRSVDGLEQIAKIIHPELFP